jgi:hypothetical protein
MFIPIAKIGKLVHLLRGSFCANRLEIATNWASSEVPTFFQYPTPGQNILGATMPREPPKKVTKVDLASAQLDPV